MPLVACADCGKQISNTAPACPNCGRPNRPAGVVAQQPVSGPSSLTNRYILYVGVACAVLAATVKIAVLLSAPTLPAPEPAARRSAAFNSQVIVWRNRDAMDAGQRLVEDGHVDARLLLPYTACVGSIGDHIVVLEGGLLSSKVETITGPAAGCVGWVATDEITP
jgi:hypothetical protein